MDEADAADKAIYDRIAEGVARASRAVAAKKPRDTCAWCGDPTVDGAQFCSKECAGDSQKYEATLKRNGIQHG